MTITAVATELLRLPLPRPVALPASQSPRSAQVVDLLLVRLRTNDGPEGIGFSYALGGGGAALKALADELIAPWLIGESADRTEWHFRRAQAELEGVGFPGLAARAYAAVDFALWDAKGKRANLPVHLLLGGYRSQLKAIVSDTATPALGAKAAVQQTRALFERGAAGVIVEIGTQDPDLDTERVRQLRDALPPEAWFEVSGAGRYDYSTALALGRLFEEEVGIDGFSDPLPPDDFDGLGRLLDRLDVGIAVGALYHRPEEFLRQLDRGGLTAVRVDPVRLGGLTPARKVALAAELKQVAVCPVRCPEVGVPLACGVVYGRVAEYVDWFEPLFDGGPRFRDGQLVASDRPGLGIEPKAAAVEKWRVA